MTQEQEKLDVRIRTRARYFVRKWVKYQDQYPIIQDCIQAAWVRVIEVGYESPRLGWEIQNAIRDEISRWLWGVNAGSVDRVLRIREEIDIADGVASDIPSPLYHVEIREVVKKFYSIDRAASYGDAAYLEKICGRAISKQSMAAFRLILHYGGDVLGCRRARRMNGGKMVSRSVCGRIKIPQSVRKEAGVGERALYLAKRDLAAIVNKHLGWGQ